MGDLDYERLLAETDPEEFASDPWPGWAGVATLFGAPARDARGRSDSSVSGWVAAGVPFDATASSRPGAAEGPRAIRQASMVFAGYLDSLGEHDMLDTRTGELFAYQAPLLEDAGDLRVYPTDPLRTFRAVGSQTRRLLASGASGVFLHGDHSMTFATFAGHRAAWLARCASARVGLVTIDHHFDFGAHSRIHGSIYHGANSRRISELPGMRPSDIAFVGVGDVTRADQYRHLVEAGFHVVSARRIREFGALEALRGVVKALAAACTCVYVSVDIDVLDAAVAPGTGSVTIGGLSGGELFDVMRALRPLPITAVDIAEVAPRYDPTGRTAYVAARLLFEYLFRAPSPIATLGKDGCGADTS